MDYEKFSKEYQEYDMWNQANNYEDEGRGWAALAGSVGKQPRQAAAEGCWEPLWW